MISSIQQTVPLQASRRRELYRLPDGRFVRLILTRGEAAAVDVLATHERQTVHLIDLTYWPLPLSREFVAAFGYVDELRRRERVQFASSALEGNGVKGLKKALDLQARRLAAEEHLNDLEQAEVWP